MYIDQINWKGEEYDIYSKEVENASTGVVDFDSEDSLSPSKFDDSVDLVESGETLSELCEKFSTTVKNVRYLGNLAGDTDISNIDSGTLTGAIQLLNETLYDSDGNIRLGTDDVGSEIQFIYLDKGKPTATTVATVGTSTKPIYINNGKFTESNATRGAWNRIMYMSSGSLVESDGAVGEDEKSLIYMKDGYFYKSGESVGSDGKTLMYIEDGTFKESAVSVGENGKTLMYLNNGTLTASKEDVGNFAQPIYLKNGELTAFDTDSSMGSYNNPVYINNGFFTAFDQTIGDAKTPVYLKSGVITECSYSIGDLSNYLPLSAGSSNELTGNLYISHGCRIYGRDTEGGGRTIASLEGDDVNTYNFGTGGISNNIYIGQSSYTSTLYLRSSNLSISGTISNSITVSGAVTISGSHNFHVPNGQGLVGEDKNGDTRDMCIITTANRQDGNKNNITRFAFGNGAVNNTVVLGGTDYTKEIFIRGIWDSTTTSSVNVRVNGSGGRMLRYSSSSQRYKDIIKEIVNNDIQKLYDIPVYFFKYKEGYLNKTDIRYNTEIPGFIAEDWDAIMPIAVDYNEDGQPEMWNSNIVVPLMFEMIKNNHTLITELQEQIAQLTN